MTGTGLAPAFHWGCFTPPVTDIAATGGVIRREFCLTCDAIVCTVTLAAVGLKENFPLAGVADVGVGVAEVAVGEESLNASEEGSVGALAGVVKLEAVRMVRLGVRLGLGLG